MTRHNLYFLCALLALLGCFELPTLAAPPPGSLQPMKPGHEIRLDLTGDGISERIRVCRDLASPGETWLRPIGRTGLDLTGPEVAPMRGIPAGVGWTAGAFFPAPTAKGVCVLKPLQPADWDAQQDTVYWAGYLYGWHASRGQVLLRDVCVSARRYSPRESPTLVWKDVAAVLRSNGHSTLTGRRLRQAFRGGDPDWRSHGMAPGASLSYGEDWLREDLVPVSARMQYEPVPTLTIDYCVGGSSPTAHGLASLDFQGSFSEVCGGRNYFREADHCTKWLETESIVERRVFTADILAADTRGAASMLFCKVRTTEGTILDLRISGSMGSGYRMRKGWEFVAPGAPKRRVQVTVFPKEPRSIESLSR